MNLLKAISKSELKRPSVETVVETAERRIEKDRHKRDETLVMGLTIGMSSELISFFSVPSSLFSFIINDKPKRKALTKEKRILDQDRLLQVQRDSAINLGAKLIEIVQILQKINIFLITIQNSKKRIQKNHPKEEKKRKQPLPMLKWQDEGALLKGRLLYNDHQDQPLLHTEGAERDDP